MVVSLCACLAQRGASTVARRNVNRVGRSRCHPLVGRDARSAHRLYDRQGPGYASISPGRCDRMQPVTPLGCHCRRRSRCTRKGRVRRASWQSLTPVHAGFATGGRGPFRLLIGAAFPWPLVSILAWSFTDRGALEAVWHNWSRFRAEAVGGCPKRRGAAIRQAPPRLSTASEGGALRTRNARSPELPIVRAVGGGAGPGST